jgi:hypothetical protein
MSLYQLALFAHLLGVLGLFVGMGLQWTSILRLRRARTVSQVREWGSLIMAVGRLVLASGALLLGAGIYMTATTWGFRTPWIVVSVAALLLMTALAMGVTTRRLQAVLRATARADGPRADGPRADAPVGAIPPDLERRLQDPLLWTSAQVMGSMALGVVFLMTTKPGLGGSLLVLGVSLVLGVIAGMAPTYLRRRPAAAAMIRTQAPAGG